MFHKLDKNSNNLPEIKELLLKAKKNGLKVILYAMKVVEPEDLTQYRNKYLSYHYSLKKQDKEIEELSEKIEEDLQLLGFLGYFHKVNESIPEVVQLLKNINVNTWLVSGDRQD